jgi:hypothetical protein
MRHLGMLLAVAATAGCASSAPYTVPAAILNSAVAAGASLEQRASGGCFAVCTNGTTCNPRTGFCEQPPPGATCAPGSTDCGQPSAYEVCRRDETGALRCVPVMGVSRPPGEAPPAEVLRPVMGISPATGTAPPPPSEASPKPPGSP